MIIPIFWPIIALQKKMMNTQKQLARQKITNAIDVWRDDLQAVGFDVSRFNLDDDGLADGSGNGHDLNDRGFDDSRGFGNG